MHQRSAKTFQAETPCDQDPKTVRAKFSKDNQDPRTLVSNIFLLLYVTWPEILETHITQHIKRRRPYYENRLKTPYHLLNQMQNTNCSLET